MKREFSLGVLALSFFLAQTCGLQAHAQEKMMANPMMDAKMAKSKLMEPATMMAAEKAMMGDKSMVPSMMAKEMIMHDLMHDEHSMATMKKAAMSPDNGKPAKMDENKVKMAGDRMLADSTELQLLFQELVARHLAAQKMAMMKKTPADSKKMMTPMMNEMSMMESKKEMMVGEAMTMMMAKESLIKALMKDPEVMSMVEKQARKLQDSSMAKMIANDSLMMKSASMAKDPAMMKAVVKDAMVRTTMEAEAMMMDKKK